MNLLISGFVGLQVISLVNDKERNDTRDGIGLIPLKKIITVIYMRLNFKCTTNIIQFAISETSVCVEYRRNIDI